MITTFIVAALTYTCLEISYWYYHWFKQVGKEDMPIVKSLLFAVAYAHAMMVINANYHLVTGKDSLDNGGFSGLLLLGAIGHLIPVWKQKLNFKATWYAYVLRVVAFSFVTSWGFYVIQKTF